MTAKSFNHLRGAKLEILNRINAVNKIFPPLLLTDLNFGPPALGTWPYTPPGGQAATFNTAVEVNFVPGRRSLPETKVPLYFNRVDCQQLITKSTVTPVLVLPADGGPYTSHTVLTSINALYGTDITLDDVLLQPMADAIADEYDSRPAYASVVLDFTPSFFFHGVLNVYIAESLAPVGPPIPAGIEVTVHGDLSKSFNSPHGPGGYGGVKSISVVSGLDILQTVLASDFIGANLFGDTAVMFDFLPANTVVATLNLPAEATGLEITTDQVESKDGKWFATWTDGEGNERRSSIAYKGVNADLGDVFTITLQAEIDTRPVGGFLDNVTIPEYGYVPENSQYYVLTAGDIQGQSVIGFGSTFNLSSGGQYWNQEFFDLDTGGVYALEALWINVSTGKPTAVYRVGKLFSQNDLPGQIFINGAVHDPVDRYLQTRPRIPLDSNWDLITVPYNGAQTPMVLDGSSAYVSFSRTNMMDTWRTL